MIDTSKIRPGDAGTIRVTFGSAGSHYVDVFFNDPLNEQSIAIPFDIIASHTPAPWVPEKDDVVKWNASGIAEWRIRAVDGNEAWITHPTGGNGVVRLSDLTLIRKGAA